MLLRGTIVNKDQILLVKMVKYIGFYLYHRSYYLWSPVIVKDPINTHGQRERTLKGVMSA